MKLRTLLPISLHNTMANTCGMRIPSHHVMGKEDRVSFHLCRHESLALMSQVIKACIDALTLKIKTIEAHAEKQYKIEPSYVGLLSLPGVGKILGLTILLETGPIGRFPAVGNYVSHCRKAESTWKSAEKVKGKGNIKNGNRYLSWAFAEAAEHARRYRYRKQELL
jgi:transposase